MTDFVITEPLVRKLLATVDAGLVAGVGEPIPGKMCVEAAISYALGEPHSDGPSCVDPIVRQAKIVLNDASWSSEQARAKGMREVAIAQLGSRGTIDSVKFVTLLSEYLIREIVPLALRDAAKLIPSHQAQLERTAQRCADEGTSYAANAASDAARDAARDAASYAANAASDSARAAASDSARAARAAARADASAAASDSASAAASYAAHAAHAASYAASAAASDSAHAASDSARAAARAAAHAASDSANAARDNILSLSAKLMVRALKECGSPGCEWLWML